MNDLQASYVFLFVSVVVSVFFWCYDSNKDMERYYMRTDKVKYNMLMYTKHLLFLVMIYNLQDVCIKYIKQTTS